MVKQLTGGAQLVKGLSGNEDNLYRHIQSILSGSLATSNACTADFSCKLVNLSKQCLRRCPLSKEDVEKAYLLMHCLQHICKDQDAPVYVLVDNGIIPMMSDLLKAALLSCRESSGFEYEKVYEEVLETIACLADADDKGKRKVFEEFVVKFLQVLITPTLPFACRLETLKTLNSLLDDCPLQVMQNIHKDSSNRELILKLGMSIPDAGDYEFQVGITEVLFRCTHQTEREKMASKWFDNEHHLKAFLSIRDSEFETDCRSFLNIINEPKLGDSSASVISIPCQKVELGKYRLRKPEDEKYTDFWVDFNSVSRRVTLFCEQDNDTNDEMDNLWETVSIWNENVVKYSVKDLSTCKVLTMQLKAPARELIGFGPDFPEKDISIYFDQRQPIHEVATSTFCMKKSEASKAMKSGCKVSSASSPVFIRLSQDPADELSECIIPSSTGSQITVSDSGLQSSQTKERPSRHKRSHKVSEPCDTVHVSSVKETTSVAHIPEPITPAQKKTPVKKVKTPLQMVSSVDRISSVQAISIEGCSNISSNKVSVSCSPVHAADLNTITDQKTANEEETLSETTACQKSFSDKRKTSELDDIVTVVPDSQQPVQSRNTLHQASSWKSPRLISSSSNGPSTNQNATKIGNCKIKMSFQRIPQKKENSDKNSKTSKMAELKGHLSATDPAYTDLPLNTHKVSVTPALSTVSERTEASSKNASTISPIQLPTVAETEESGNIEKADIHVKTSGKKGKMQGTRQRQSQQVMKMTADSTSDKTGKSVSVKRKRQSGSVERECKLEKKQNSETQRPKTRSTGIQSTKGKTAFCQKQKEDCENIAISKERKKTSKKCDIKATKLDNIDADSPPFDFESQEVTVKESSKRLLEKTECNITTNSTSKKYKFFKTKALENNEIMSSQETNSMDLYDFEPDVEDVWERNNNKSLNHKKHDEIQIIIGNVDENRTSPFTKKKQKRSSRPPQNSERQSERPASKEITKECFVNISKLPGHLSKFQAQTHDKIQQKMQNCASREQVKEKNGGGKCSRKKDKDTMEVDQHESSYSKITKIQKKKRLSEKDSSSDEVPSDNCSKNTESFADICQGVVKNSGKSATETSTLEKSWELSSDSDLEVLNMEEYVTPAASYKPCAKKKKKRLKKSVFSDDAYDTRSEVSWLDTTGRKKKPKLAKSYHGPGPASNHGVIKTEPEEPADEEFTLFSSQKRTQHQPVKQTKKKKAPRKRQKKVDQTPEYTEDETDQVIETYYSHNKSHAHQNNKVLPNARKLEAMQNALKQIELQTEFPHNRQSTMPKTPTVLKKSGNKITKRPSKSPLNVVITKTPNFTPASLLENRAASIERARFANDVTPTPNIEMEASLVIESLPPTPKFPSDQEEDEIDMMSQTSAYTHISSLKTPAREISVYADDELEKSDIEDEYLLSGPCKKFIVEENMDNKEDSFSLDEEDGGKSTASSVLKPRCLFGDKESRRKSLREEKSFEGREVTDDDETSEEMCLNQQEDYPVIKPVASSISSDDHLGCMEADMNVPSILKIFNSQMEKKWMARRQLVEQYTKQTAKSTHKQILSFWDKQQNSRCEMTSNFHTVLNSELNELEHEVTQLQQEEEESLAFVKERLQKMNAYRLQLEKRMNKFSEMTKNFNSEVSEVEELQKEEQYQLKSVIARQMQHLQKKLLLQSQQQELMNVKRSLRALFL